MEFNEIFSGFFLFIAHGFLLTHCVVWSMVISDGIHCIKPFEISQKFRDRQFRLLMFIPLHCLHWNE